MSIVDHLLREDYFLGIRCLENEVGYEISLLDRAW